MLNEQESRIRCCDGPSKAPSDSSIRDISLSLEKDVGLFFFFFFFASKGERMMGLASVL